MPLYEYQCQSCQRRVEKIQKFSDAPLTVCPHCGGTLERTLTAPAIQFKGSGWYKDLYSSPKPAASAGTSDSESSSNSPTEGAKPASPGETGKTAPSTVAPANSPATTSGTSSGS